MGKGLGDEWAQIRAVFKIVFEGYSSQFQPIFWPKCFKSVTIIIRISSPRPLLPSFHHRFVLSSLLILRGRPCKAVRRAWDGDLSNVAVCSLTKQVSFRQQIVHRLQRHSYWLTVVVDFGFVCSLWFGDKQHIEESWIPKQLSKQHWLCLFGCYSSRHNNERVL